MRKQIQTTALSYGMEHSGSGSPDRRSAGSAQLLLLSLLFIAALLPSATGCRSTAGSSRWLTPKTPPPAETRSTAELGASADIRGQSAPSSGYSYSNVPPNAKPAINPVPAMVDDFSSNQLEPFPFATTTSTPAVTPPSSFGTAIAGESTVPSPGHTDASFHSALAQPFEQPVSPSAPSPVPAGQVSPTPGSRQIPQNPPTAPFPVSPSTAQPVPQSAPQSTPDFVTASPLPAFGSSAAAPPPAAPDPWGEPSWTTDPWGFDGNSGASQAVSIESAAKAEEERAERARLTEIATANQRDGTPDYLKPLDNWNGPFETRERKKNLEQDIIRQVGYIDQPPMQYDNFPVYDWEKEEQKAFDWSILDPVNFFTKVRDWVGLGPDEAKANAAMKKGREILLSTPDLKDRKKCLDAAKEFATAASRWPDSVLEEDALHLAGECYFFGDDYPRALKSYQKLVIKYQHSKYIDNAVRRLFAIGRYWEQEDRRGVGFANISEKSRPTFDTFGHCKRAYETIFTHDPNGPISDDAMMALATAYLAKGRYQGDGCFEQAAYYYGQLRENHPLSKHIAKAHEYELFARSNAYLGAEYDSKMLDDAEKLADVTLRQFSTEISGEDKEEILTLKENVVEKQAEREWTLGQYYDKKQYYGSARMYYEKLLDRYPQTVYAEKARVRLDQIRDKPAKPDQFSFFKKLFKARGED